MAQGFADGIVGTRMPFWWVMPPFRFVPALVANDDRTALFRALDEISRSSCIVLPPDATFEIIGPRYPCRALLARTAVVA